MPYVSKAQQGFAHSPAGKAAGFPTAEFDAASKGLTGLPKHVGPKKSMAKKKARKKRTPMNSKMGGYTTK